jgi:hypothetical protein
MPLPPEVASVCGTSIVKRIQLLGSIIVNNRRRFEYAKCE